MAVAQVRVQNNWSEISGGLFISIFEELASLAFSGPRDYLARIDQDPTAVARLFWEKARQAEKEE